MPTTTQEAAFTLFNAAEIPEKRLKAFWSYVDHLVTSPKNSVLYYWSEENSGIPWWRLLRYLKKVLVNKEELEELIWQRIISLIDRRRPVCLPVDDFVVRRYGKKAFRAGYFYSNAYGGIVWGNALVNTVIKNGELSCPVSHDVHAPKGTLKLWERGLVQVKNAFQRLLAAGMRRDRIWITGDCTYGNKTMAGELQVLGGFYLLGIPKNRTVELFGRSSRIDEYFSTKPVRRLTVAGRVYRYKISIANLKNWGRRLLLSVWEAGRGWKYYASNNLKITVKTLLLRKRDHWSVENNHRDLKQFHGAEHFHVWKEQSVLGHFQLVYTSGALTCIEKAKRRYRGIPCTVEQLHREAIRWSRYN